MSIEECAKKLWQILYPENSILSVEVENNKQQKNTEALSTCHSANYTDVIPRNSQCVGKCIIIHNDSSIALHGDYI